MVSKEKAPGITVWIEAILFTSECKIERLQRPARRPSALFGMLGMLLRRCKHLAVGLLC